jgi:hypothetical protein
MSWDFNHIVSVLLTFATVLRVFISCWGQYFRLSNVIWSTLSDNVVQDLPYVHPVWWQHAVYQVWWQHVLCPTINPIRYLPCMLPVLPNFTGQPDIYSVPAVHAAGPPHAILLKDLEHLNTNFFSTCRVYCQSLTVRCWLLQSYRVLHSLPNGTTICWTNCR